MDVSDKEDELGSMRGRPMNYKTAGRSMCDPMFGRSRGLGITSSKAKDIIQKDHAAILDIFNQLRIIFKTSIIQMNVCLVQAFPFLRQFRLVICPSLSKNIFYLIP